MFVKTSKFMEVLSSENRGEVYFDYAESRKTQNFCSEGTTI